MERRGWEFKNKKDEDTPTFNDIAQDLYSPEELKEREKFLKKQFGDNVEGL